MTQTGVKSSRAGKVVRGQAARRRPPPPAASLGAAISASTWKCLARYILLVGLFSNEHSDEALAEALEDEAEAAAAIPVLISQDVVMIRFMIISSFTVAHENTSNTQVATSHDFKSRKTGSLLNISTESLLNVDRVRSA
jgi:hypothetical protein